MVIAAALETGLKPAHQCRVGSNHSGWVSLDTLLYRSRGGPAAIRPPLL